MQTAEHRCDDNRLAQVLMADVGRTHQPARVALGSDLELPRVFAIILLTEAGGTVGREVVARLVSAGQLLARSVEVWELARTVEGDRLANERLEVGLVDLFSFVDVDRAA